MRTVFKIILTLTLLIPFISKCQNATNIPLSNRIDSLSKEDQKWRNLLTEYDNNQFDSIPRDTILYNLKLTDSLNYLYLKDIINEYGFPNFKLVGENASHNFWLLIQHQDKNIAFQKEVLELMKKEVHSKQSSLIDYAYLLDRVQINSGEFQVYGTQMIINSSGNSFEPKPCINPDKLDDRRKEVGLPPINEYIRIMNDKYFGKLIKE